MENAEMLRASRKTEVREEPKFEVKILGRGESWYFGPVGGCQRNGRMEEMAELGRGDGTAL